MEAVVILLLVIIIICWACYRRKLEKATYGIAALDIFLRVVAFISNNIGKNELSSFLSDFPDSLLAVADKYLNGFLYMLIAWAFVILMVHFFVLTLRTFFKK